MRGDDPPPSRYRVWCEQSKSRPPTQGASPSPNTIRTMRRKNQGERRGQLARAAREVLLERGAVGVRVKDVADRAGLAPSSVLYYYPSLDELLIEVSRGAIERFTERRAAAVRRPGGAREEPPLAVPPGGSPRPGGTHNPVPYEMDPLP